MRRQDWPGRLQALLEHARHRSFRYGDWDCCQWGGYAVEAVTGANPLDDFRNRYTTAVGAERVLRRYFGGTLRMGWTQLLGEAVDPRMAGRGDIVLLDLDGREAVGVVDLSGEKIACVGPKGLEYIPIRAAIAAWKV